MKSEVRSQKKKAFLDEGKAFHFGSRLHPSSFRLSFHPSPFTLHPFIFLLLAFACVPASASAASARVAVLDFGETEAGRAAAARVAASLGSVSRPGASAQDEWFAFVDRDLARAAARGAGYAGSLNMTLREARDLGAAIDCDFFIVGDTQTIRRSSSEAAAYFESYASVFVVSARTGRLVAWDRPSVEAPAPEESAARLLLLLDSLTRTHYAPAIREAREREARERGESLAREDADFYEDLSGAGDAATPGDVRAPEPFRRLRPAYPDTAARAEAEATVDVLVSIGADGEVRSVEVARWAGFGLDESVVRTVRQMHFRPATRGGTPFASRVLLRYNFRRPPKPNPPARQK